MRQIIPLLIMIAVHLTALSQSHTFKGRVFEQNGIPVPFATITIKGTKTSILCNEEGIFYINAKAGDNLVVSAINFQRGETTLTSEKYLKITLTRISNTLPNVVVTNALDVKREQRT